MSLYPTPRRRWLLAAVRSGDVARYGDGHDYHHSTGQKLSAAVADLLRAGWIEPGDERPGNRPWRLTDKGRTVLDG